MATTRAYRPVVTLTQLFQCVTLSIALFVPLVASAAEEDTGVSSDATAEAESDSVEPSQGFRPSRNAQVVDAVVLRPLDFTKMCVGSALLVVGAPFAVAGGLENLSVLTDIFVIQPYQNTFEKPLGMIE